MSADQHAAAWDLLRSVIGTLREVGRFTDEEGEATDMLESLLVAYTSDVGADQHHAALRIVHEEAGRTLSKDDFDLCMRIAKRAQGAGSLPVAFYDPNNPSRQDSFVWASDYPNGTKSSSAPLYAAPRANASVSMRLLRQLVSKASFSSNVDRLAALECLDEIAANAQAPSVLKDAQLDAAIIAWFHYSKEYSNDDYQARMRAAFAAAGATPVCETCNGHGMIGGPSFREPDEGGEPCPACNAQAVNVPRMLPADLTPPVRHVLSLMLWQTLPIANALRATGRHINRKTEDEQAAALHWLLGIALEHGENWEQEAARALHKLLNGKKGV